MGKYELVRQLASGRLAHTFLALIQDGSGDTRWAVVKQLRRLWTQEPHVREAFLRRARRAAELHHPNVAKVLDAGLAGGLAYAASEHIDGRSLRELLIVSRATAKPIPFPLCAKIVSKACLGFEHAHAQGVVHGHLTAGHVVIDMFGEVKVVDWGMGPDGEPPDPSPRLDIMRLGAALSELIADRRGSGAVPDALERIVEKALAAAPSKQYATCFAMRVALERFIVSTGQPPGHGDLAYLSAPPWALSLSSNPRRLAG